MQLSHCQFDIVYSPFLLWNCEILFQVRLLRTMSVTTKRSTCKVDTMHAMNLDQMKFYSQYDFYTYFTETSTYIIKHFKALVVAIREYSSNYWSECERSNYCSM